MNFELILAVTLAVTGVIWLFDMTRRVARRLSSSGRPSGAQQKQVSWVVDFARSFFPVLLVVFALRSFVVEPFRIPSGSMLPTLKIGDFILVNKFRYGVRLPIANDKIIDMEDPQYGDVMVFRYPHDESVNYIKRVIGLPGDRVSYTDKTLSVNGQQIAQEVVGDYSTIEKVQDRQRRLELSIFRESFGGQGAHQILHDEKRPPLNLDFIVPEDQYFVMGDNRDHSNDSRFWGFVPQDNVIGKAFLVWFSWDYAGGGGVHWERIGTSIE